MAKPKRFTEKLLIYIEPAMRRDLEEYAEGRGIKTLGEAIRELIRLGLEASQTQQESRSEVGHGKV